ncbi:MAG: rhodanese-like domain-containing protein [Candidatus Omnitrophota bacterium]
MIPKLIKQIKQSRKIVIFIILQNIILIAVLGVFLYFRFYKSIYDDQYLFPQGHSPKTQLISLEEVKKFNPDYIVQEEDLLEDKEGHRTVTNEKYGITGEQIEQKIKKGGKVYFIDVREIEEYKVGHINGAIHLRGMDLTIDKIKEGFGLNQDQLDNSLFILVCHDGGRGLDYVRQINKPNIKYLIKGIEYGDVENISLEMTGPKIADFELFGRKYQTKYQMKAEDAIKMINSGEDVLIIDGRAQIEYRRKHIKGSVYLKCGRMTTTEYEEALEQVLKRKGAHLIALPDRYGELFYANLLFYRLENYYGFDDSKFHIVFHQFEKFNQNPDLETIKD